MSNKVTVYSIDFCPFCTRAKMLLQNNGVEFQEIMVDKHNEQAVADLMNKSGMRTFPQIFHGDELIGGFTELKAVYDKKGLEHLK